MQNAITVEQAETLFAEGQVEQARLSLEQLLQVHPQNTRILNDLGVICFAQDRLKQAEGYLLRSLEVDASNLQAMANLVDVYRRQSRWADAVAWLERQLQADPQNVPLINQLAVIHLEAKRPDQARPLLERSLALDPAQQAVQDSLQALTAAAAAAAEAAAPPAVAPAAPAAPQVPPGDGADAQARARELVSRLLKDPADEPALQQARGLIASRSIERLRRSADMGWLFLQTAFAEGKWGQAHFDLLGDLWDAMPADRRRVLLETAVAGGADGTEILLMEFLGRADALAASTVEAVEAWMARALPTRIGRDAIERAICLRCRDVDLVRRVGRRAAPHVRLGDDPADDFLPRRLNAPIQPGDLFLKQVPPDAPAKTGLRILLMGDVNVHGHLTALMRALNRHTHHAARCIILQADSLDYDRDLILRHDNGRLDESIVGEVGRLIRSADFFHIGRKLLDVASIDWDQYLSPSNCVVQYYGSYLRAHGETIAAFHQRTRLPAITSGDWTLARLLPGSFTHLPPALLDLESLPAGPASFDGPLMICHAPASAHARQETHSERALRIVQRLIDDGAPLKSVTLSGLPNRQCLKEKARCHLHLLGFGFGMGMGAIESAAMGVVPVGRVPNAWLSMDPDCPIVNVTPETAPRVLADLLADRPRLAELSARCRHWARTRFAAATAVRPYVHLIDLIYHGLSADDDAPPAPAAR